MPGLGIFRTLLGFRPALLGAGCLFGSSVWGQLSWDSRKVELTAQPEDTAARATFRFTNTGSTALRIVSVHPSCGCTTVDLPDRTYAPGERGELVAVYQFEGAVGEQAKTIRVSTSEAPETSTILTLRVAIPEVFKYSERLLLWRVGGLDAAQAVTVTSLKPLASIEPGAATAATARVEPIQAGKSYRLILRPKSVETSASIPVTFRARFADGTSRTLAVYVVVR